jgi:Cu-Zn family superoxide dismutase
MELAFDRRAALALTSWSPDVNKLLLSCAVTLALAACGRQSTPPADQAQAPAPAPAETEPPPASATVQLAPTQGNSATGTLTLTAEGTDVVRLTGSLQGLPPNAEFGFHIHENGDCSAPDASSAGGHFNPANAEHGDPAGPTHHAGDMLNVKSDAQGMGTVDATASGVTLASAQPNDVLGKAVVLHAKPDDYKTQPSGASGDRIACGVIGGK